MDFEKICMVFSMKEPYYGILLSSMKREPTFKLLTLGVCRDGNVFKLYYNPDYIAKLSVETTCQALKHECLHVAFAHFSLWDDDGAWLSYEEKYLRNIAADMECNSYLDRSIIPQELGWVFPEDHGFAKSLGTLEYYKRLLKEYEQQVQEEEADDPQQDCNGGMGGDDQNDEQESDTGDINDSGDTGDSDKEDSSTSSISMFSSQSDSGNKENSQPSKSDKWIQQFAEFDDHSMWPDDMTDTEREQLQEDIDTMLAFAAEEVEKGCGSIPGELVGRIEQIRAKKPRPAADWKRYFRRYLGNEYSELLRKSKKRESKRFPDAAGNRHRRKSHILVGIDTSGSVSMPEYREFFGQLRTLAEDASFHVVECDAWIQYEYDFNGKPNETLHGGGGTNFQPVVDLFLKHRKEYDALVYFTDGECWIPKNTPKETLWVVSSRGDHNKQKYRVNGASVVFIPKHK